MWYNISQGCVKMLKIKVNFDKKSYTTLLNDMKLFKITKSDGTPNKNKFMNLLFKNYYLDYIKETESIISNTTKLMKKYNMENLEFASELAQELFEYKHPSIDTYYSESLTFYLSEENEFIFETLNQELAHLGASAYFRKLIYRYLEYPQYKREEIIYKHILDPIYKAIDNNQFIKIKLEKSEFVIKPYKIGTSKEEIYSYLLGLVNSNPISINIFKIKVVVGLKTTFTLTKEEEKNLNDVYRLGIQFPFKKICNAIVELNKQGIKLFNSKYLNRPEPIKIEDNKYYFECSFDQLLLYFLSFGSNAKIIKPNYLRESIYKSYKGYTDNYEEHLKHIKQKNKS